MERLCSLEPIKRNMKPNPDPARKRTISQDKGVLAMRDPRVNELARLLVTHSMKVKPGENVLIDLFGEREELARALIAEVYRAGGFPFYQVNRDALLRAQLLETTEEHMELLARFDYERMKAMDCYVAIRGRENINELADVPSDRMKIYVERYNSLFP